MLHLDVGLEYGNPKSEWPDNRPKSRADQVATHRRVLTEVTYGAQSRASTPIKSLIINYFGTVAEL